jgi:hypothetical protein
MVMSQPGPTMPIEPFSVRVADEVLADLRARIRNTRWPDPAPGDPWEQGTDLAYLRQVLASWAEEFDWRAQERHLNTFNHFRAEWTACASTSSTSGHGLGRGCR